MSLEEGIATLAAALNRNSDLLERVVAGQEAALAKLEGGATTSTRSRGRPKKDDEPAPAQGNAPESSPAATEPQAGAAEAASESPLAGLIAEIGTDVDKMKALVAGWTGATDDAAERAKRVDLLKAMAAHFGGSGYTALVQNADTAKQAIFFVERAKALGVSEVNLKADYDFSGDPKQGAADTAGSDDDFG